ncbi:MAG TPA: AraC family transcriptional regulator [Nevskia sp.]|nr:AraC family transcriptional regulator [Nevskia sp.]
MEPKFEMVHVDAASSFHSTWFSCPSFAEDHTWHYHPEFELTWVVRSQGTRFVGDSIEPYRAGDLVLIGPNLPHCWHDERSADGGSSEAAVVQFRPEIFGHDLLDLPEFEAIKRLFRASKCGLHIEGEAAQHVQSRMRALFDKSGIARLICLLEILTLLADAGNRTRHLASVDYHITNDITEVNRKRIEMVHRYVRQNLAGEINQAEAAKLVGLTPPAFSRFFRRATGQTFVGFVNILRINEVCRTIAESNECITNIAMNCGYNNIANFNRQFLALKGMNPSQYRERRLRLKLNAVQFATGGSREVRH